MTITVPDIVVPALMPRPLVIQYLEVFSKDIKQLKKNEQMIAFVCAKRVLAQLRSLGWCDAEISYLCVKYALSLPKYKSFPYFAGWVKSIKHSPVHKSVSDNSSITEYASWIDSEIARLS